jgi:hypothetical protein
MVMMTIGGFTALMFQFISLTMDTKRGERQLRDRVFGQILNDEIMRLGNDDEDFGEKAKRMMRLTDDGELEELIADESAANFDHDLKQQGRA